VGELLSIRFALAAVFLWVILLLFKPQLIKLSLRQILISIGLGVLGYAVFSTLYFKSIEGISVPLAAMLLFTFPLFVNLGAHFILKERMSKIQVVCLTVATLGLILLLWGNISVQKTTAIFFGLGSGLAYSIYVLVSGRLQTQVPPLSSSLYVISSAAVALYVYHQPSPTHLLALSLNAWLIGGALAIVCTIAPLTLFLAGLQKMKSSKASVIVMIEPVTASIAAVTILHEVLSPWQLLGGTLVIGAVIMDSLSKS